MQSRSSFRKPPTNRTMGMDLECQVSYEQYDKLWQKGDFTGFWYMTRDGSIRYRAGLEGIEFVSEPLTPEWLTRELNRLNKKVKWKYDESCGIHIHVSRQWLTLARAELIYKFMREQMGTYNMTELFGRYNDTYSAVCYPELGVSRYSAINTENKATIEFRVFASGDAKWAQYCVAITKYMIDNAKHLNIDAMYAFYDNFWKGEKPNKGTYVEPEPDVAPRVVTRTLGELLRSRL